MIHANVPLTFDEMRALSSLIETALDAEKQPTVTPAERVVLARADQKFASASTQIRHAREGSTC